MKVKDLITKLSEYDQDLDVCMCMYCTVEDGYYTGDYYAGIEDIYVKKILFPINKSILIFYGDTDNLDKYLKGEKE